MNARTAILALPLLAALACPAEISVFDKPARTARHLQLLSRMDAAHHRRDYAEMAEVCGQGLRLGTSDELWHYNLACALALQGQTQPALDALDRALDAGFADAEHLRLDPDLESLRPLDGFAARLDRLAARGRGRPASGLLAPMRPDASMTATQTASNTVWNFELGVFHAFAALTNRAAAGAYCGPEQESLRAWLADGSAAGCAGLLYANRDGGQRPLDHAAFPGLVRVAYSQEMVDRRLHLGLPNTLYTAAHSDLLTPVVGHSSMGYLNSPYGRSQPRAICGDPRQLALQSVFLLGNQLHLYPVYADYDPASGDLFPANTPYCLAVAGGNHAEEPFLRAAFAALAALRPEARDALARDGLLMPALQMLFRASQRSLRGPRDYLTGAAHPPAFLPENLDVAKLVRLAHSLATNDLPLIVTLAVLDETRTTPSRDFFDAVNTERQFDSALAVARVFRGSPRTRTYTLRAACKRADARLHWVLLQGDPAKVSFAPCPTNAAVVSVTVAHHAPFHAPLGGGRKILTSRVDVGVIAETPAGFSLPSLLSVYMLGNERRTYAADGRIASIDYTRRAEVYVDPLLSYPRNWKDTYHYDAQGLMTGWTRRRGLAEERFTAYGHKVVATDALGRASRAHVVRYVPRVVKEGDGERGLPDLAQLDDNIEVCYRYASDDDRVGAPDLDTLTQETAPPARDP